MDLQKEVQNGILESLHYTKELNTNCSIFTLDTYFKTDFVILNCGRMTSESASSEPNCHATPIGGRLTVDGFDAHQTRIHSRSSMELGLETTTIVSRSRFCNEANAALEVL
ncbi:hypothetical protein AVEN_71004-1 [Araneus ventricosus]|uniref:Uncharacterized protein n=1 Tax=Araneus ventricosus TaxID=182803 RepID=A0A4Y2G7N1_ARAVE|nr:hypothetical protein AVEN_71004-1 [Araneus ventricosus]